MDPEFHVVILERHEGNGRLGAFTKEEAQRVKVRPGAHTGVGPVGTLGYILGEGIYGNLLCEDGVLCVYHVTAYEKFHVVYDGVPTLNVERLRQVIDGKVRVAQEVTTSLKLDGGHGVTFHSSLDRLFLDGL